MSNPINIYYINAFTNKIFPGNPAAVCVLEKWYADDLLQSMAKENNLPVTAFLVKNKNHYEIRWITPEDELELCGHGALSAGCSECTRIQLYQNRRLVLI